MDNSRLERAVTQDSIHQLDLPGWTLRKALVIIGFLPFVAGAYGLYVLLLGDVSLTFSKLAQAIFLFGVGFFLVSLSKRAKLSARSLLLEWRVFFIRINRREIPLEAFSHIRLQAMSESHFGGVGGGGNRTANFYRIELCPRKKWADGYLLSQHKHFRRDSQIETCLGFVERVQNVTGLAVECDELVKGDIARAGLVEVVKGWPGID